MKVLVADDSGVMRKIIVRSLNAVGITDVIEACDGDEGWQKLQNGPVELVLADWNMPNGSGLELLKQIRQSGSHLPVIMVATEAEKSKMSEALEAGVTDYLCKPFDTDQLREKLDLHNLRPAAAAKS